MCLFVCVRFLLVPAPQFKFENTIFVCGAALKTL